MPEGIDVIALALDDIGRWDSQLLELVKDNKINPWDIDIELLTQHYLEKINSLPQFDFRIPGKAVLTLAVLLRMKSERLNIQPPAAREAKVVAPFGPVVIPELKPIRRAVERKVTLMELVEALRDAFEVEKRKIQRKRLLRQIVEISRFDMGELLSSIREVLSTLFKTRDKILLTDLLAYEEFAFLFLALLHLANEGTIDMEQAEWNSEIFIIRPAESFLPEAPQPA